MVQDSLVIILGRHYFQHLALGITIQLCYGLPDHIRTIRYHRVEYDREGTFLLDMTGPPRHHGIVIRSHRHVELLSFF